MIRNKVLFNYESEFLAELKALGNEQGSFPDQRLVRVTQVHQHAPQMVSLYLLAGAIVGDQLIMLRRPIGEYLHGEPINNPTTELGARKRDELERSLTEMGFTCRAGRIVPVGENP